MVASGYSVRENTGNSAHPPIDEVVDLALKRGINPRPADHPDHHFDQYISDAVDQFGEEDVTNCINLILVNSYTHRMAGSAAFGNEEYVWGINVGVAATAYLRELRRVE